MRYIALDTETTGLRFEQGHRLIEIGCLEIVDRFFTGKKYHQKINPKRTIDESAQKVHGMSEEDLVNFPEFHQIVDEFCMFIKDSTLIIHNAAFDTGFLNNELVKIGKPKIESLVFNVIDSLILARSLHPGKRNSLDALCSRYSIDNSSRVIHGAILDAQLLGEVYLAMTRGQESLKIDELGSESEMVLTSEMKNIIKKIHIQKVMNKENEAHIKYIKKMVNEGIDPLFLNEEKKNES